MKKVSIWFLIAFIFFLIGEIIWSIQLIHKASLFENQHIDDWVINIMFLLCSLSGTIGSYKWYKNDQLSEK